MLFENIELDTINLLVIEDNEHDFKQVSRALRQLGVAINITRCIRAEEAFDILADKTDDFFDVLLTDFRLPGMSGLELSAQLFKKNVPFPIILLTGEGDENIAVKALKMGLSDYLRKDLSASFIKLLPEAIIKAIHNHSIYIALKQTEEKNKILSAALEQSQSAVVISNLEKSILYVNEQFVTLSGYTAEELIHKNIFQFLKTTVIPEPNLEVIWQEALQTRYQIHNVKKRNKKGDFYWVTLSITPILNEQGDISFMLFVEDSIDDKRKITQLENDVRYRTETGNALNRLREKEKKVSEKLALKIKELSFRQSALDEHAIVSITDIKGNIIYANQKFCDISQYSTQELLNNTHRLIKSNYHANDFFLNMWRTISRGDVWHGEIQNKAKDGSLYWVSSTIAPMLDDNNKPQQYIAIRTDITDTKQQQETLQVMAHYDVLTKLPNRILLIDRFSQAVAHNERNETILAVCFLDLDNFKPINDRYGHNVGDNLLIDVASRIKDIIRDEDTVSRQGGDEFILLLGDIKSIYECETSLERLIHLLNKPYQINGHEITITASVGYTFYPLDDGDLDTLVRHADHAMYEAKMSGRNSFHRFNTKDNRKIIKHHSDLKAIRDGFLNKEFCLFYQPKVNLKSGIVFGAEALIRWQNPENGLVLPMDFLPHINGTQLEVEIGNWVLNEAIRQQSEWKSKGCELEVSINVSSYYLLSKDFLEQVGDALASNPDVDGENIQLEILESRALGDINKINRVIKDCRQAHNISIALDDFGTGYSSLTHLRNISADIIKIDKSFVRDMLDDSNDYAIIDGVIGLASAFNRGIIAEGVETIEQGLLLINMECEYAQGYAIAKPMPANEMMNWINAYQHPQKWLGFTKDTHSPLDNKKQFFVLLLATWVGKMEDKISSENHDLLPWPMFSKQHNPTIIQMNKERKNTMFSENLLNDLDKVFADMVDISTEIYNDYQTHHLEQAKLSLTRLKIEYNKALKLLL